MTEFADKYETLLLRRERSRLHVTLNRPEVKNALNPTLIGELKRVFAALRDRRDIKVVILRGAGGTFCAGADLKNMEQSFSETPKPGQKDPIALNNREYGTFLEMVNTTPQTVVAAVEGYAIAGGFGLLCVSDVAICTEGAGFAMSETAIGIVPAQIAPFVAARIGVPQHAPPRPHRRTLQGPGRAAARHRPPPGEGFGGARRQAGRGAEADRPLRAARQRADQGRRHEGRQRAAVPGARLRRRQVRRGAPQPRGRRGPARLRREAAAEMGRGVTMTKTALHIDEVPARIGTGYPPPHDVPCRQRSRRRLSDAFGLTQFGFNLLELPPGAWSSHRHWHQRQDEMIYVLEGEVTMVTDAGETVLTAGMFAGYRAGTPDGHHLINKSNAVARVLEMGTRTAEETAHYVDIDMMYREGQGYSTRDGRPLT